MYRNIEVSIHRNERVSPSIPSGASVFSYADGGERKQSKHRLPKSYHSVLFCFSVSCQTVNPFRTAVPFWGQTSRSLSTLSPKWGCGSKRVNITYIPRTAHGPQSVDHLLRGTAHRTYGTHKNLYISLLLLPGIQQHLVFQWYLFTGNHS